MATRRELPKKNARADVEAWTLDKGASGFINLSAIARCDLVGARKNLRASAPDLVPGVGAGAGGQTLTGGPSPARRSRKFPGLGES